MAVRRRGPGKDRPQGQVKANLQLLRQQDEPLRHAGVIDEQAPGAIKVFDKFQIVRHLLDAVEKVRKEEVARLKEIDPERYEEDPLHMAQEPENLSEGQHLRLSDLVKLNLKINRADQRH